MNTNSYIEEKFKDPSFVFENIPIAARYRIKNKMCTLTVIHNINHDRFSFLNDPPEEPKISQKNLYDSSFDFSIFDSVYVPNHEEIMIEEYNKKCEIYRTYNPKFYPIYQSPCDLNIEIDDDFIQLFDLIILISYNNVHKSFYYVDDFRIRQGRYGHIDSQKLQLSFIKHTISDLKKEEYTRIFCRILSWVLDYQSNRVNSSSDVQFEFLNLSGSYSLHNIVEISHITDVKGVYNFVNRKPVFLVFKDDKSHIKASAVEAFSEIILKFGTIDDLTTIINKYGQYFTASHFIKLFEHYFESNNFVYANYVLKQFEKNNPHHLYPKSGGSGECIMKSNIATSPTHHSGLRFQILEGSKGVVGEILKS